MATIAKQSFHVEPRKGVSLGEGKEFQRNWNERGWEHALKKGTIDLARQHLNFEIANGKIQPIDRSMSLAERMAHNLKNRGIKDPNEGLAAPRYRTAIDIFFTGSHDRLTQMAFGDQPVTIAGGNNEENLGIERQPDIEQWAVDTYNYVAGKFGEENILGFYVHLDETTPHAHVLVLPVDEDNKLNWKHVMHGEDKIAYSNFLTSMHDELAAVNAKWGMERGTKVASARNKQMSIPDWRREMENRGREKELELAEMDNQLSEAQHNLKVAETKVKSFTTMVENKTKEKEQLEKRLKELTRQIKNSDSDKATLEEQIKEVKAKLETTNTELADKQTKLAQAEADKAVAEEELKTAQETAEALRQETNKLATILRSQSGTMVKESMLDMVLSEFKRLRSELPPEQMAAFDGSYLEYLAERGNEMLRCSVLLFTGFVNDATTFAEGHGGGGGGSDLDWGREKDEDDRRWARRCVSMANRMMRPATRARKR